MLHWRREPIEPLTEAEIEDIERRYAEARLAGDLSALTILAVEVFPHLLAAARGGLGRR